MIVDLERNDLSRASAEPGSVRWPELMATRELAGVEHMVSTVEGTLREESGWRRSSRRRSPGGSVTGAPKIAAVDLIAELEPVGRGASMGALGDRPRQRRPRLALTIRTFAIAEGRIHLWVGGGVVWDSDPAERWRSWTKARPLLEAIGPRRLAGRGVVEVGLLALAVTGRGLIDPNEPAVRADDEALLHGRAAFETLKIYAGRPFGLDAHLDRLVASAEVMGLPPVERRRRRC